MFLIVKDHYGYDWLVMWCLTGTGFKANSAKRLSPLTFSWNISKSVNEKEEDKSARLWIASQSPPELWKHEHSKYFCVEIIPDPRGHAAKAIHALWILGRYEEPSRSSPLDARSRGVHSTLRSTGLEQIPTPLYRLVRCWGIRPCRLQGYNPLLQFLISANGACSCAFSIDPHHWPRTEPITFKYKCFLVPSKKSWSCVLKNLPSNTALSREMFSFVCALFFSVVLLPSGKEKPMGPWWGDRGRSWNPMALPCITLKLRVNLSPKDFLELY